MAEVSTRPAGAARGRGRGRRAVEEGGQQSGDGKVIFLKAFLLGPLYIC